MPSIFSSTKSPDIFWHVAYADAIAACQFNDAMGIIWPYVEAYFPELSETLVANVFNPSLEARIVHRRVHLRKLGREVLIKQQNRDSRSQPLLSKSKKDPCIARLVERNKALNSLVSIAMLPTELLLIIFGHAAALHTQNIYAVSLVCSAWRELVCRCPELWTTVVCDRSPTFLLDLAFQRAEDKPVNVGITSREQNFGKLLRRRPDVAGQIHKLVIHDTITESSGLGPLAHGLVYPQLDDLGVIIDREANPRYLFGMREGERFPALRMLYLDGAVPIATSSEMISEGVSIGRTLRRLIFANVQLSLEVLGVVLKDCSILSQLQLRKCRSSIKDGFPVSGRMRRLDRLVQLELWNCEAGLVRNILLLVDAPNLKGLRIWMKSIFDDNGEELPRNVFIYDDALTRATFIAFLCRTKVLKKLMLEAPSWALAPLIGSMVDNHRMHSSGPLLPVLTRLKVRCRDLGSYEVAPYKDTLPRKLQASIGDKLRIFVGERVYVRGASAGSTGSESRSSRLQPVNPTHEVLEEVKISEEYIQDADQRKDTDSTRFWESARFKTALGIYKRQSENICDLDEELPFLG